MERLEQDRFHNACRILMNIEQDELQSAGVIPPGVDGAKAYDRLCSEPLRFVAKLDDASWDALWAMIEERQPKRLQLDGGALYGEFREPERRHAGTNARLLPSAPDPV